MYVAIDANDQTPCAIPSENLYIKVYKTLWLKLRAEDRLTAGFIRRSAVSTCMFRRCSFASAAR